MNAAELARIAATLSIPVDATGRTRAHCAVVDGRHRVVFALEGRRQSEPVGPAFAKPREAIALAALLNGENAVPTS